MDSFFPMLSTHGFHHFSMLLNFLTWISTLDLLTLSFIMVLIPLVIWEIFFVLIFSLASSISFVTFHASSLETMWFASHFLHSSTSWTCPHWTGGLQLHHASASGHFQKLISSVDAYKLFVAGSFITAIYTSLGNYYF